MFAEAKAKLSALGARVSAEKLANIGLRHRLKESTVQIEKTQKKLAALGLNISVLEKSNAWVALRIVLETEAGLRRSYLTTSIVPFIDAGWIVHS